MFIHRKLTTTCCVAVLALGLVACGSSDDDTSMTDPTTIEPMDSTAAEQLANAQAAVADAQTIVAALAADSSHSDRAAAYAALAEAQSVLAEASGIPENAIALLKTEIARLQGITNQAETDAKAEEARIAELKAGTKEAETKRMAIATEAMGGIDGIGGSVETGQMTTYSMTIVRDRDGKTVTITDTAFMGEDEPKFVKVMDLGNGRTMHTRTMEADPDGNVVTEVVIVSTDIDAPTAKPFADEYMLNTNPVDDVDQSFTVTDANLGMWSSSEFPSTPDTMKRYPRDEDAMADENTVAIDGKFDGADGTFVCVSGDSCSLDTDADGELATVGGTWHFTPDEKVTVDVADADYLNYGFWLQKTADEDGAVTYNEVETFAGSELDASAGGSLDNVQGTASYEGGATGVYVHSEVNPDGSNVATTAGHFKADASLTAHFGGTSVAVDLHDTVTGTIDNFALSGEEKNAWSVALKGGRAAGEDTVVSDDGANGGGAPGAFTATFHGPTPPIDADNVNELVAPGAVIGEFDANFSNGSVAGGFGARKQ